MLQAAFIAFCIGSLFAVSYTASRCRRPVLTVLLHAAGGAAALAAVNLLARYTAVGIALNFTTAFIAVVLGMPGVILLLLLRLLLQG